MFNINNIITTIIMYVCMMIIVATTVAAVEHFALLGESTYSPVSTNSTKLVEIYGDCF